VTKLLEETIQKLRELPEDVQDMAAKALMRYLDELSTMDDRTGVAHDSAH
jgi:hypothetical protein